MSKITPAAWSAATAFEGRAEIDAQDRSGMAVTFGRSGLQVKLAVYQLGNHLGRSVEQVLASCNASRRGGHWEGITQPYHSSEPCRSSKWQ